MKKLNIIFAAVLAMSLSACNQKIGVGTDQSSTDGTSNESSIKRNDSSALKKTNARSIKMPAAGIIAENLAELMPVVVPKSYSETGELIVSPVFMAIINLLSDDPEKFTSITDEGLGKIFTGKMAKLDSYRESDTALVNLMDKAVDGDLSARREIVYMGLAVAFIYFAIQPVAGWPFNPGNNPQTNSYVIVNMMRTQFVNALMTEISTTIPESSLSDPSKTSAIISNELAKMGYEKIQVLIRNSLATALKHKSQGVNLDMVSGKGTSWKAGSAYYTGDQSGWNITQNGIPYFGGGKLSGQEILVSLDSTVDLTKTVTRDIGSSNSQSNSNATKATTNVQ